MQCSDRERSPISRASPSEKTSRSFFVLPGTRHPPPRSRRNWAFDRDHSAPAPTSRNSPAPSPRSSASISPKGRRRATCSAPSSPSIRAFASPARADRFARSARGCRSYVPLVASLPRRAGRATRESGSGARAVARRARARRPRSHPAYVPPSGGCQPVLPTLRSREECPRRLQATAPPPA